MFKSPLEVELKPDPRDVLSDADAKELLKLAGVDPTDAKATGFLRFHYRAARSIARLDAIQRPLPTEHNPPLERVQKAADELREALSKLNASHPHANSDLWMNEIWELPLFVPPHDVSDGLMSNIVSMGETIDDARAGVMATLQRISKAADEARYERNHRPPDTQKKRIVECAFQFYVREADKKPTQTPTGKFGKFVQKFYDIVLPNHKENLDRAIRDTVSDKKTLIARRWPK